MMEHIRFHEVKYVINKYKRKQITDGIEKENFTTIIINLKRRSKIKIKTVLYKYFDSIYIIRRFCMEFV